MKTWQTLTGSKDCSILLLDIETFLSTDTQTQRWCSYISSEDDSGVELQRCLVLLIDLLLSLCANFTFGLLGETQRSVLVTSGWFLTILTNQCILSESRCKPVFQTCLSDGTLTDHLLSEGSKWIRHYLHSITITEISLNFPHWKVSVWCSWLNICGSQPTIDANNFSCGSW